MKSSRIFSLIVLLSVFGLTVRAGEGRTSPCSASDPVLKGQVTDAVTKKPVSGVTVSVKVKGAAKPCEVVTDEEGFFYFKDLPTSEVNLVFDKKGYRLCQSPSLFVREKTTTKLTVEVHPDAAPPAEESEYPILRIFGMK